MAKKHCMKDLSPHRNKKNNVVRQIASKNFLDYLWLVCHQRN